MMQHIALSRQTKCNLGNKSMSCQVTRGKRRELRKRASHINLSLFTPPITTKKCLS